MGVYERSGNGRVEALAARTQGVGVTRLTLTEFRNYRSARLDLELGPVVLSGPNGAGKTNLLEAVSFLSPGRGLRNARLGDLDRRRDAANETDCPGRPGDGQSQRRSRPGAGRCASEPAAILRAASGGRCGSTAKLRAAKPRSANWSGSVG